MPPVVNLRDNFENRNFNSPLVCRCNERPRTLSDPLELYGWTERFSWVDLGQVRPDSASFDSASLRRPRSTHGGRSTQLVVAFTRQVVRCALLTFRLYFLACSSISRVIFDAVSSTFRSRKYTDAVEVADQRFLSGVPSCTNRRESFCAPNCQKI